LTTRKSGNDKGKGKVTGERERPPMKSSHEKVKVARGARRAAVAPPRARAPARPDLGALAPSARDRFRPKRARSTEATAQGGDFSVATESARNTAAAIAMAAIDKKAIAVEILDVSGKVDYADFLVIMTGGSDRHASALAQGIEEALRKKGVRPVAVEGLSQGTWVLIDFGDVVVHVFQDEARQLYDIEGLWLDARRLPVPGEGVNETSG
jgi:ribosome-associated protein